MRSIALLRLAALLALATFAALPALAQQDQSADPVADAARKPAHSKKTPRPQKRFIPTTTSPPRPSLPLPQPPSPPATPRKPPTPTPPPRL